MTCACVQEHVPALGEEIDRHHVFPVSWGGQVIDPNAKGYTRLATVCPTTHRRVHRLLNRYVKLGARPPAGELRHFNATQRALAEEAWNHPDRPARPSYTTAGDMLHEEH